MLRKIMTIIIALLVTGQGYSAVAAAPQIVFQWPWELGQSWAVVGGFSNGKGFDQRSPSRPHNYLVGGALDLAPHNAMRVGENTANFWVYPTADGTVEKISPCFVQINHGNGIKSLYYHLDRVDQNLKVVYANRTKLGVIANNKAKATCSGGDWEKPHLHFAIRFSDGKTMEGVTLSGWAIHYNPNLQHPRDDHTTFSHRSVIKKLSEPIENMPLVVLVDGQLLEISGGSRQLPNQSVTARFTIRNNSNQTVTIRRLTAGGRGPNPVNGWNSPNVDFPEVQNIRLAPDQTYTYQQKRTFSATGQYFIEPVMQRGDWGSIWPYPRLYINVAQVISPTFVPAKSG